MDLYADPRSPNCIKVQAVAAYLSVPLDVHAVDLSKGEQRAPDLLALNPLGQVPVLRDGERVLTESDAIIEYLADMADDERLRPQTAWDRADVSRWLHWSGAQLAPAVRPFQWERMFKPMLGLGRTDAAVIAAAEAPFRRVIAPLEAALQRTPYLAGDEPGLGDFSCSAMLVYAEPAQLPLREHEALQRWRRDMTEVGVRAPQPR